MMAAGAELDMQAARAMGWTKPSERGRCDVCGWPVVPEDEPGCWASNCSMRPPPEHRGDVPAKVSQEAGYIPRMLVWLNERGLLVDLTQYSSLRWAADVDTRKSRDAEMRVFDDDVEQFGDTIQHALANLVVAVSRANPSPDVAREPRHGGSA